LFEVDIYRDQNSLCEVDIYRDQNSLCEVDIYRDQNSLFEVDYLQKSFSSKAAAPDSPYHEGTCKQFDCRLDSDLAQIYLL